MKKMLFMTCFLLFFVSCGENAGKDETDDAKVTTDETAELSDDLSDDLSDEVQDIETEAPDLDSGLNEEQLDEDVAEGPLKINAGTGIGNFEIGMKYSDIKATYGEPSSPIAFNRLGTAKYKDLGIEVILTSTEQYQISDDAKLLAVGAMTGGEFEGDVLPGMTRAEIEALLKDEEKEDTGKYVYYTKGFSVEYEDDVAVTIGVYKPYELKYDVPPMEKCKSTIK
jgi:hypothetical protein